MQTFEDLIFDYNLDFFEPIVVGVSFGPDSMALLDRLITIGFKKVFVAHIHHGLRNASDDEEKGLKQFCLENSIPIHVHHLEPMKDYSNLEDRLRGARYTFFQQIYRSVKAQALFLGHHANEQVEVGLKRIFEGASLASLSGMKTKTFLNEMWVCRPQLFEKKDFLIGYLEKKKIPYAIDPTNFDGPYLRAKMRSKMVPFLEEIFGKNIQGNVLRFMDEMRELDLYLQKKVEGAMNASINGPYGIFFPKEALDPLENFELSFLLTKAGIRLHETKKRIIGHLRKNDFGKKVADQKTLAFMEKKGLFILEEELKPTSVFFD
ncbi:MAG: tRNA lysidine(34) synthetase TilS, partial [Chlamydiae bacterium]|nr:tRNA lysidine(34) synthetase TilS [Chlamydiota bacterium]